jgi:hypothetical protein
MPGKLIMLQEIEEEDNYQFCILAPGYEQEKVKVGWKLQNGSKKLHFQIRKIELPPSPHVFHPTSSFPNNKSKCNIIC